MTIAIDSHQRQFGMAFDHMPYSNSPHFTNPWTSSSGPAPPHNLYASSNGVPNNLGLDAIAKHQASRINSNASMPPYGAVPITTSSAGSSLLADVYGQEEILTLPQDLLSSTRMQNASGYASDISYTTSAQSSAHSTYVTATPYDSMGYAPAAVRSTYALQQQQADNRRLSHPSVPSASFLESSIQADRHQRPNSLIDLSDRGMNSESARNFGDAIDASRGMIAMSQNATPRNTYGPGSRTGRGSGDSYGFPATHSTSSSISSGSNYPAYFGGSVDSSVSDYSNAGSDIESVSSRTLPRPSNLLSGGIPPAPQSMMGQFSSKVSSSTQKKHKCKICDKRFTRPSSLQTHMYSHTGEKRRFP
jgi:Zinc finger, C2H2 type